MANNTAAVFTRHYDSPMGRILLAADEIGLRGLWFDGQKYFARDLPEKRIEQETHAIAEARRWLDVYFTGKEPDFLPPLHPAGSTFQQAVWALLRETVNLNSRDKVPSPSMAGATARAIFSGGRYPASLLESTMLRIRAELNITWGRAAIIKAYYLKNPHEDCPKEVLTVSLNAASTNTAYTLGRLFSVYEAAQQTANPGINATIKDKYFNSAAAMPASIFPVLNNLYQKHLRKLEGGQRVYYDKQVMALKGILGESYPARMTLAQQGAFDLGYYHQTQKRFTKKEEENNV